ncbi:SIS domain-containing protein [Myxococcota bacterium]|nr:SIS domain-containing protein [Myxococcota bacterium]
MTIEKGPGTGPALARQRLGESADLLAATREACADSIAAAASLMVDCLEAGGRVLAFGNGGSAADAQHLAAELTGRFERDRPALSALALTANSSDLTAIGNDYDYSAVFSRLVEAHGRPGDVVIAISTSGESPNVCEAARVARDAGLRGVALTGRGGGSLAQWVDVSVEVPSDRTARIQEAHAALIHVLCELVEETLFGAVDP